MANFIPFLFILSAIMLVGASSSSKEISPVAYWDKLLPKTPIPISLDAFLPKDIDDPSQRKHVGNMLIICIHYSHYKIGTTLDQLKGNPIMSEIPHRHMPAHQMILHRRPAHGFPFSSSKLADILKCFSLDPNSADASIVKHTLEDCEMEANKGETRYCATSLESMVDFAVSKLKTNDLQLLTYSFVNKEERESKSRVYTVQPGVVELASSQAVVCHIQSYPYAVFHCYTPVKTKSYIVPLVAEEDGSRMSAGAVCHNDTSSWNPNHASMLVLGIKPGTPVCHFLSLGHFAKKYCQRERDSYCATSLESMVDFTFSQLKTNDVRLLSTSILDKGTAAKGRVYTVQKDVTEFPYKDSVVCHVLGYPYAVFYCHKTINTSSYVLPLVAEEDGSRVDARAVCHTETSSWNPKHATFQTLGVKPGVPICHFLPYGHFAWFANSWFANSAP
ncbi:hypothetical protein EJ110_NYTH07645 [Nymphaea thermarum]|nr:hypothetical protein EJ110_NYTH07645 [Nymphaea thermarum]